MGLRQVPLAARGESYNDARARVRGLSTYFAARQAAFGRCCGKSRKLSSPKNLAKICFQLPLPLQAAVGHVRSPVVAFLWVDVVPHLGMRRTRQRRGKISSATQKYIFDSIGQLENHRRFSLVSPQLLRKPT